MNKLLKLIVIISVLFVLVFQVYMKYLSAYVETDYYTLSRSFDSVDQYVELLKQDEINKEDTSFDIDEDNDKTEIVITNRDAKSEFIWMKQRKIVLEKISGQWAVTFSGVRYRCHQGHDIGKNLFYISTWERFECK